MTSQLIAGDEAIDNFVLSVWSIEDPIICIWTTEKPPDEEVEYCAIPEYKNIDKVKLFIKEQIQSLFFPFGFSKNKWSLVLLGIKEEADVAEQTYNGILKGWITVADVEDLTLDIDF